MLQSPAIRRIITTKNSQPMANDNQTVLMKSIKRNQRIRQRIILEIERMERNADGDTEECKCAVRQRSLLDLVISEDEKLIAEDRQQWERAFNLGKYSHASSSAKKAFTEKYGTNGK
jgi:hypothetical protein